MYKDSETTASGDTMNAKDAFPEVTSLLKELQSLRDQLQAKSMIISDLEGQIKDLDSSLDSKMDQLQAKENLLDAYRTDNKKLTEHVVAWDNALKETKKKLQQRDETIKELKEALKKVIPIAERMQSSCEDGETKCYDNEHDSNDAVAYKEILDKALKLID